MRRRQQIAFYAIMVMMTLAVIEGMAQAAYYIAFGEFNGAAARPPAMATVTADDAAAAAAAPYIYWLQHPYHGHTRQNPNHVINQHPPPRREEGAVLIGLAGGSVSEAVSDAFRRALETWFQDNAIPLRPVVLELAWEAFKQPQQVTQIASALAFGGEYDIIVNLDGYNELVEPFRNYYWYGISPFYPVGWHLYQQLSPAEQLRAGRIAVLRQRQQRLHAVAAARPWRWSALYGIVNRYLRERTGAQIRALNYELANDLAAEYSLQRHGPVWPAEPDDGVAPDPVDLSRIELRVWYRGSVLLADLSRTAGAEYYHFQQPNQYVPGGKPLSAAELADAYDASSFSVRIYQDAYPLLRRLGAALRQQGINYHDLTQLFSANQETLYSDDCCHLNARGNELLAASMVRRLEPALWRRAALAGVKVGGRGGV